MLRRKRILVVGGGYAGLTAAYELSQDASHDITLIEQSDDLGGLAGGLRLCGTNIEKTYHHLFRTDTDILRLANELGLGDKLLWLDGSIGIYIGGRTHRFSSVMDLLRFRPCRLLTRLRLGLVVLYLQKRKDWRPLVKQTAYTWMSRACGNDAMRIIWGPLLRGKFDRYHNAVSMAWLWARIHIRANSRTLGQGEKLGYFSGGFNVLTEALRRTLAHRGVVISTRTSLERLSGNERKALIQGKWKDFDACIFTGPSYALARVLPEGPQWTTYSLQLRSIEYLGAVCLLFTSEQSLGEQYWLNVNEPGAPFLVFLHHTKLVDPANYDGKHVYYIGSYVPQDSPLLLKTDDAIAAQWFGYLRTMFKAFDPGQVQEKHVFRFRAAQHIVDTGYEARIPATKTPMAGVYLANFSQIFPEDRGTNYAVRQGRQIAGLVAADLHG